MVNSDTIIVTSTFYPTSSLVDTTRSEISKRTIKSAIDLGYEIIVVDSGSKEELISEYKSYGATVHVAQSKGMGAARREGIQLAADSNKKYIVWTEPEKEHFIPLIKETIPALENGAEMVIPKRKSLASYPLFQQQTERVGNLLWLALTGVDIDIYFGPRVWKKEVSHYFLNYNGEYGDRWDSIFLPVMDAVIGNCKLASIEVDFTYSKDQTLAEQQDNALQEKRLEQLRVLSIAFDTHWRKHRTP